MVADLTEMYGLEGSLLQQYGAFWQRLFRGDFGVSFFQFPTPVTELIRTALPWTAGPVADNDDHLLDAWELHRRLGRIPLAQALVAGA